MAEHSSSSNLGKMKYTAVRPFSEATRSLIDFSFIGIDQVNSGPRKCDFNYLRKQREGFRIFTTTKVN